MIEHIFFDLDGTVVNSQEGVINSVVYSLKKLGKQVLSKEILKKFIGPPLVDSYMNYCGLDRETALKAIEVYRENYREKGLFEYSLYDGVVELIGLFKAEGKKVYIATSKPEIFALKILSDAGIDAMFDGIFGATLDSSRVKKADVLSYAISSICIEDISKTILIGDTVFDVFGAKEKGIKSLAVTYGYETKEALVSSNPDYIVDSPLEILKVIK